jgi:hypothetical protein
MATFDQIKAIRLVINDPTGSTDIQQVASSAFLPAVPGKQTVYQAIDSGRYYQTYKLSGAALTDYFEPEMWLSDTIIGDLFDSYGHDTSIYRAIRLILTRIGSKMSAVRIANGADSVEYNNLRDLYAYYKGIIEEFKEQEAENTSVETGKYFRTRSVRHHIAGGNL